MANNEIFAKYLSLFNHSTKRVFSVEVDTHPGAQTVVSTIFTPFFRFSTMCLLSDTTPFIRGVQLLWKMKKAPGEAPTFLSHTKIV